MPQPLDKPQRDKKANLFQWEIRPEPSATPRERVWLIFSVTTLLAWMAALVWLAYR